MQLPVGRILHASFDDVRANIKLAFGLSVVLLAVDVASELPPILGRKSDLLPIAIVAIGLGPIAWVKLRWTDWVAQRVSGEILPAERFWPTLRASMKFYGSLLATMVGVLVIAEIVAVSAYRFSASASAFDSAEIISLSLAFVAMNLLLTKFMLLPSRAALGLGTSVLECFRELDGSFWKLFRLELAILGLNLVIMLVNREATVSALAFAVHAGWITHPAHVTWQGSDLWRKLPRSRTVVLITYAVTLPIWGTIGLVVSGSLVRAALILRDHRQDTGSPAAAP